MQNSSMKLLIQLHCFQSFGQFKVVTSTVQSSVSGVQRPESSVKLPGFRVQHSKSRVQCPYSTVQRPESSVQLFPVCHFLKCTERSKYDVKSYVKNQPKEMSHICIQEHHHQHQDRIGRTVCKQRLTHILKRKHLPHSFHGKHNVSHYFRYENLVIAKIQTSFCYSF